MTAPTIYLAHPITGEYIGTDVADADPLNSDGWIIPAHAYFDAPPPLVTKQIAVRTIEGWEVRDDAKGYIWNNETGERIYNYESTIIPDGFTQKPWPGLYHVWVGSEWVYSEDRFLEEESSKARKIRDSFLSEKYDAEISRVMRELRMTDKGDSQNIDRLNANLSSLDSYAVALLNVPQQPGFPTTINWPEAPAL